MDADQVASGAQGWRRAYAEDVPYLLEELENLHAELGDAYEEVDTHATAWSEIPKVVEHLRAENERLRRQIVKLLAGEKVEPSEIIVTWLE